MGTVSEWLPNYQKTLRFGQLVLMQKDSIMQCRVEISQSAYGYSFQKDTNEI
jgi:hypothetical protein